jgi:hypothetical protein
MDPGIRIRIKNVTNPEHWGKPQRQRRGKSMGKDKREGKRGRQGEDTGENNRLMREVEG